MITSLDNSKIKKYRKLRIRKYRNQEKLFLIEGEHLVREADKYNLLVDLLVLEDYDYQIDFPYTKVSLEVLKSLTDLKSIPKMIGIAKMKEEKEVKSDKVLILDDIADPGNLGTIIRSSLAFNIQDIILSSNTVDIYNEKVIRASQGMLFGLNFLRKDLQEAIFDLKKEGYCILGTNVINGSDVREIKASKFALIVGNEGQGVKKEIQDICDKNIYIKMNSQCESLNVGVAASIILYELSR